MKGRDWETLEVELDKGQNAFERERERETDRLTGGHADRKACVGCWKKLRGQII